MEKTRVRKRSKEPQDEIEVYMTKKNWNSLKVRGPSPEVKTFNAHNYGLGGLKMHKLVLLKKVM